MQKKMPRQSLRERQRKERENLILQAAEEVLSEKGYHETSMDEIATRVGIAKGTVYLHFPSKEDLIFALFERELETFLRLVDEAVARDGSARIRLEAILHGLYKGLIGKRLQLLLSLYTSLEIRQELLEKKQQIHVCLEQVATQVTALLEEGKANGEFDTTIPTPVMLTLFFSLFSPRGYKRLIVEEHMPLEELVGHLSDFYFKGIAAK
jgi:TetR/AcrR family transcriptional regulator, fatty acid metabolism regulator protein